MHETLQLAERGITDFDLFHRNYLAHNEKLWTRYRLGQIRQEELRTKRMWLALLDFKIADEELAEKMSTIFLDLLPTRNILFPFAIETLSYLRDKGYQLHLITNGFEKTQRSKLEHSGLADFFTEIITSECSNSLKPNKEIFDFACLRTRAAVSECLMIGDSIEVDIMGAYNAGIDQVYVNHNGIETEFQPTYTIRELRELQKIL